MNLIAEKKPVCIHTICMDAGGLFFIEFLIVLFFFLIISTVCLRLFVQSHSMTKRTEELFQAQEAAASVAELLEAGGDSVSVLLTAYPEAVLDDSGLDPVITICFDQDFHSCSPKKESYSLTVPLIVDNHEESATISVCKSSGEVIYTLDVSFHRPLTREEVLS